MKKKYLYPTLNFILLYLLGSAIYYIASLVITKMLYPTANSILPSLFPIPNYVLESEKYELYEKVMAILTLTATFYLINLISVKCDNARFERIVLKTEGMYRMKDGLKEYYSANILFDAILSLVLPIAYTLPIYIYVPREFIDRIFRLFFLPAFTAYDLFGIVGGAVALVIITFVTRTLAGISAVKGYRARWLSADVA